MHSALYHGRLRHRRFAPAGHAFEYRVFMAYLDLAELDEVFRGRWFWSTGRVAAARLRREDYLGDPRVPLDTAVRDRVEQELGRRPSGPIRMLTNLRMFGFVFNPVTFYYCFDASGSKIEALVAEITNTPWGERHAYVLDMTGPNGRRHRFAKRFHVSPFLPMDLEYDWRFGMPRRALAVHMEDLDAGRKVFDATLALHREEITGASLARTLAAFPFITLKIAAAIYWQALRLWLKRTPFHTHPMKLPDALDNHRPVSR